MTIGVHQNTYGIYSRYALQWAPPWLGPPGENCLQFVWDNLGVIWPDAISLTLCVVPPKRGRYVSKVVFKVSISKLLVLLP